jgi:class 3 adenylate cyclase/DNA-binding beta-propeller fold protein YncE
MSPLPRRGRSRDPTRLLATILFTDIVGSTERAVELGDRRWRQLLGAYHGLVRKQLKRLGGREVDTAGDGFFATFDQPARAIECAGSIVDGVASMGIQVRVGIHMGEVEASRSEVRGVAVHIGARIMSMADPGEVLVSSTVRDLMAGSEVRFEDRGFQELKGVPAQWHLFAVQTLLPKDASEEPLAVPPKPDRARRRRPRRWIVTAVVALAVGAAITAFLTRGGGTAARRGGPGSTRVTVPDNAALQIDPASGRVRTTVTGLMAGNAMYPARHIEVGEGGVWVDTAITLQHIDPRTGTLVGQIQAQPLVSTIAVGQGAVWAAGNVGITRISPATDKVEATIRYDTGEAKPIRIAVAGGEVWMLVTDGRLIRVDAGTNRITRRLQIGTAGADLAVTPSALWALDPVDERVYEVDPKTARIVRRVSVAGNLERVVVGAGEIWVLDEDAGVVTPIDPTTGVRGAPIRVGAGPVDMTFGLGAVWVANRGGGTITRIEPQLLETRTIQVGGSIAAIAVDPDTRTLWVYLTQRGDP